MNRFVTILLVGFSIFAFTSNISAQDGVENAPTVTIDSIATSTTQKRKSEILVLVKKDTSVIQKKSFSEEAMKNYRSSDDFVYNEDYSFTSALDKLFDTLKRYFIWLLEKLFGPLFAKNVFDALPSRDIVIYTITFVLIGLIILFFYKSKLRFLFYKKSKKSSSTAFIEENIHEIDFQTEILLAEDQQKFRLAIRLQFLSLLKQLDIINFIQWESQKTNREYIQELNDESIRSDFEELVSIFEYVWYGEFTPNIEQYKKAVVKFSQFRSTIESTTEKAI